MKARRGECRLARSRHAHQIHSTPPQLRIATSILTSDESHLSVQVVVRTDLEVVITYVATPSHEKTYQSAAPPGTLLTSSQSRESVCDREVIATFNEAHSSG